MARSFACRAGDDTRPDDEGTRSTGTAGSMTLIMKIALDPFMHRHLGLEALPAKVKALGYDWIELSPRGDFLEWFKAPRVFPERVRTLKRALADADVGIASLLPMYPLGLERRGGAPGRCTATGRAPSRSPWSSASTR